MSTSDVEALADIDRRLNHSDLTALERAQLIVQRKEVWQRLHPESVDPAPRRPGNVDRLKTMWTNSTEDERTEFREWLDLQGGE